MNGETQTHREELRYITDNIRTLLRSPLPASAPTYQLLLADTNSQLSPSPKNCSAVDTSPQKLSLIQSSADWHGSIQ